MIISARVVQKPRKVRTCFVCGYQIDEAQVKIYESVDMYEKPVQGYCHIMCAENMAHYHPGDQLKVQNAIDLHLKKLDAITDKVPVPSMASIATVAQYPPDTVFVYSSYHSISQVQGHPPQSFDTSSVVSCYTA